MIKKRILGLFFSLLMLMPVFSQQFPEREAVIIKEYDSGNGNYEFGYQDTMFSSEKSGPSSIAFDQDDNLYIVDTQNKRIVVFDKKMKYKREISNSKILTPDNLEIDDDKNIIGYYGKKGIVKMDGSGRKQFEIIVSGTDLEKEIDNEGFFLVNNYVFAYKKDGGIIAFKNPGNDRKENIKRSLRSEKLPDEIKNDLPAFDTGQILLDNFSKSGIVTERSPHRPERPEIKRKQRIYTEKGILSRDFNTLMKTNSGITEKKSYASSRYDAATGSRLAAALVEKYSRDRFSKTYIGEDRDGNKYWLYHIGIIVFNRNNEPVTAFDTRWDKWTTIPVINSRGDIFYMLTSDKKHILYKIKRDW